MLGVSRRQERVGSLIRRVLAHAILHELSDPRIEPLTSITRVEVSPDLSFAKIFVSVMAPEGRQRACLEALRAASGRLRGLLGREIEMRQVPEIAIVNDDSLHIAARTMEIIERSVAEDQARRAEAAARAPAEPEPKNQPEEIAE